MGKHIPKAAGLTILAVITPLAIWDASRTSDALDEPVAQGTVQEVVAVEGSRTRRYLKQMLGRQRKAAK